MNINGYTSLYGIVANPIRHSLSPFMHNYAFNRLGINSVYLAFEISPAELKPFIQSAKTLPIKGFNVSMPFKHDIIQYLDEISEEVKLTGACNTVKIENEKLIGISTDGEGFIQSLKSHNYTIKDQKFVVLGSGGAAKSIILSLARYGAKEICIYNRTYKDDFNQYSDLYHTDIQFNLLDNKEKLHTDLKDAYMLIQTTSVGMNKDECLIDESYLYDGLKVVDIIYKNEETLLLKMAKAKGLECHNGIGMLVYQGALSFKFWTDLDMPVNEIIEKIKEN